MPRQTSLIPKAVLVKIAKDNGAPRVSDKAAQLLLETVTNRCEAVARKAIDIAKHRGSRTVNGGDIILAGR